MQDVADVDDQRARPRAHVHPPATLSAAALPASAAVLTAAAALAAVVAIAEHLQPRGIAALVVEHLRVHD